MKKLFRVLGTLALALCIGSQAQTVHAAQVNTKVKIKLDDKAPVDVNGIIKDGKTYLGLRDLGKALNLEIDNSISYGITISNDIPTNNAKFKRIILRYNDGDCKIHGSFVPKLSTITINNTNYVQLKELCNLLTYKLYYVNGTIYVDSQYLKEYIKLSDTTADKDFIDKLNLAYNKYDYGTEIIEDRQFIECLVVLKNFNYTAVQMSRIGMPGCKYTTSQIPKSIHDLKIQKKLVEQVYMPLLKNHKRYNEIITYSECMDKVIAQLEIGQISYSEGEYFLNNMMKIASVLKPISKVIHINKEEIDDGLAVNCTNEIIEELCSTIK